MRRRIAALCVAAIVFASMPAVASEETHGISCRLTGVLTFRPAIGVEPRTTKIAFSGHMTHCVSTTGIGSGDLTGRASSTGGCSYGSTKGRFVVEWDDGSETVLLFDAENAGAWAVLSGQAARSDSPAVQEGDPIGGVLAIDADPAHCLSGIKRAQFQGQGFGGDAS